MRKKRGGIESLVALGQQDRQREVQDVKQHFDGDELVIILFSDRMR